MSQVTTTPDGTTEEGQKEVSPASLESTTADSEVEAPKEDDLRTNDKSGPKKPAGPLGEAEVEAEKVAQELYPEEV